MHHVVIENSQNQLFPHRCTLWVSTLAKKYPVNLYDSVNHESEKFDNLNNYFNTNLKK